MGMKAALYFAAGVVVGSAATFFVVKGYFEKRCEERVKEAWEDADERFNARVAARIKAEKNRQEKEERERQAESEKEAEKTNTKEERSGLDIRKVREEAQKKVRSYRRNIFDNPPNKRDIYLFETGEEDEEGDETDKDPGAPREQLREDPYVISEDQMLNEHPYYDKVTLYLYTDGNVVDDCEKPVDNLEALIGKENLERIEELADENGAVLIRNEMRSSDYELVLMDETYIPDTAPVRED